MPLFEMTNADFRPLAEATFSDLNIKERGDLQRLLRTQIKVLDDDLYVLAEEFSDWEDSDRRIDLLAIDKQANLVVIELKRTNDGGHMELQALRYASMVSAMTFERAVIIHAEFLAAIGDTSENAQDRILGFLGWGSPDEEAFAPDVRIVLVSMNFGRELTTTVLWLRERDLDIRCIRMQPYSDGERRFVDVQQIIPLPEAADYQVQLREKGQAERKIRNEKGDHILRYWQGLQAIAREKKTRFSAIKAAPSYDLRLKTGIRGIIFVFVVVQDHASVQLYIDHGSSGDNKRIFDFLLSNKDPIETACGMPLSWERLDAKRACRVRFIIDRGGYRNAESEWPGIQMEQLDAMVRLEAALKPFMGRLPLTEP